MPARLKGPAAKATEPLVVAPVPPLVLLVAPVPPLAAVLPELFPPASLPPAAPPPEPIAALALDEGLLPSTGLDSADSHAAITAIEE